MARKTQGKQKYTKLVNERYTLSEKRGGGTISIEAWVNADSEIIKYSIAYINHELCQHDNGRVLGYDNAHDYHHKHSFGEIEAVKNFKTYEDILARFEQEIKRYIR